MGEEESKPARNHELEKQQGEEEQHQDVPYGGELFDAQGPDNRGQLVRREAVYVRQGPLPDAEEMIRYKEAIDDAPERILRMAESEVEHRHGREKRAQFIAAGLATTAVVGGFVLILSGYGYPGLFFTGLGVTPMIYAFLSNQRQRSGTSNK